MNEYERRLHQLKFDVRYAINKSGLDLSTVETVLEALRAEILQIENTTLKEELAKVNPKNSSMDERPTSLEEGA